MIEPKEKPAPATWLLPSPTLASLNQEIQQIQSLDDHGLDLATEKIMERYQSAISSHSELPGTHS